MRTLGDVFPAEIERVKELAEEYRAIGPAGAFGFAHISHVVTAAERAWAERDTIAMVRLYPQLQNCE